MAWESAQPKFGDEVLELELKRRFATFLLKTPNDPFRAACCAFPDLDAGRQLFVSQVWPLDPYVLEATGNIEPGELEKLLPPKEGVAFEVLTAARTARSTDDKIKAYKLYAEMMGHIEKPGGAPVTVNVNRVMEVRDHGSDEEWERQVATQQKNLVQDATTH